MEKVKISLRPEIDGMTKEDVQNELEGILSNETISLSDIERGMKITGYGKDKEYWTLENGKSLATYENIFFDKTMEIYRKEDNKKELENSKKSILNGLTLPFRELMNYSNKTKYLR